jgi:integrase
VTDARDAVRAAVRPGGIQLVRQWPGSCTGEPARPNPFAGRPRHSAIDSEGIKIRLKRLGATAGVADVRAHRWRHSFARQWKLAGGDTGDQGPDISRRSRPLHPLVGPTRLLFRRSPVLSWWRG